jgi:glycosyltransferase involved in cell wall biosynthesis
MREKNTMVKNNDNYMFINDKKISNENYFPKVSFCIPTKNEGEFIEDCLKSISTQNYPNIEIIIVDAYSKDKTIEIAKKYGCYVYYDQISLGNARQISIDKSTGEILALWDADTIIPYCDWLKNAVILFKYFNNLSTVSPKLIAPDDGSWAQKCYAAHSDIIFKDRIQKNRGVFGLGNSLFLKEPVDAVGGLDTSYNFGEDFILAKRLKDAGYSVAYHNDPVIHNSFCSLKEIYLRSLWGLKAFKEKGIDFYQQNKLDMLRENIFLGFTGMFKGIIHREMFWLIFPFMIIIKTFAYSGIIFLKKE